MTERDSSVTLHKTNVQVIPFWSASLPRGTVGPILRISAFHFSTCAQLSVPFHPRCKSFFLSLKSLKPIEAPFVCNVYFSLSLSLSLSLSKPFEASLIWVWDPRVCLCLHSRSSACIVDRVLPRWSLFISISVVTYISESRSRAQNSGSLSVYSAWIPWSLKLSCRSEAKILLKHLIRKYQKS